MIERLRAPSTQSSLHLPPPDAWKQPDRWLNPDKLEKFYAPTDDRRFVIPDATVETIRDLFWDDYEWPFDYRDLRTLPDDHHFHWEMDTYQPIHHGGSDVPAGFRELATNRGLMPRQFHNVIHHVTREPEMPCLDDMAEYIQSYMLAKRAFTDLFAKAKQTVHAQRRFSVRREDVRNNPQRINGREHDEIGEAILASQFDEHFKKYKLLLEEAQAVVTARTLFDEIDIHPRLKPHRALRLLSSAATARHVNYVPLILGRAA